jgi:threonyl-tRNA synthetase
VGDKEMAAKLVSVRNRKGEDLGQMSIEALVRYLQLELQAGDVI